VKRVVSAVAVVVLAGALAVPAVASTGSLRPKLLSLSQLPQGWLAAGASSTAVFGCRASGFPTGSTRLVAVGFNYGSLKSFPLLTENLATFKSAASAFATLTAGLGGCGHVRGVRNGKSFTGTVTKLAFTSFGNQSAAFRGSFSFGGSPLAFALLVVRKGSELMEFEEGNLGTVNASSFRAFAADAANKM